MSINDEEQPTNEAQLGKIEFYAMNNPVRRLIQKYGQFRVFKKFLQKNQISLSGKVIIDAGCGSGYSSRLIMDEFNPSELIAFDIMPEQIAIARKRYQDIRFNIDDLLKIRIPDNTADAVYIFGILHHIPGWRKALKKVAGFLKQSGVLLVDEPRYRFTWSELEQGIQDSGLSIRENEKHFGSLFSSYMCLKQ